MPQRFPKKVNEAWRLVEERGGKGGDSGLEAAVWEKVVPRAESREGREGLPMPLALSESARPGEEKI